MHLVNCHRNTPSGYWHCINCEDPPFPDDPNDPDNPKNGFTIHPIYEWVWLPPLVFGNTPGPNYGVREGSAGRSLPQSPNKKSLADQVCPNNANMNWGNVANRTIQGFGVGFANGVRKATSRWEFYALSGAAVGSIEPGGGTVGGAVTAVIGGVTKDIVGGALIGGLAGGVIGAARECWRKG